MRHERIVAPDVFPVGAARSLGICMMVGAGFWSGILYLAF